MADDSDGVDLDNPHPSIHDLFSYYNQIYFEGKLGACSVKWSGKRMTLCAGVCQYSAVGGCDIRLSEPLLKFRPVSDLKNTLLHEMIHAYLFLTNGNRDHDDHGPRFQHLMMMINSCHLADEERPVEGYAITIFHSFKQEVDLYRVHMWRCVNCADLIKRAMNRKPSPSDCFNRSDACTFPRCHWHMHQRECGGAYEKIHEPAGYVDKRKQAATLASADGSKVVKGGANSTRSGQKRKLVSTSGISKKGAKGPPLQGKIASLEDYFCAVEKDDGIIAYTETTSDEKLAEGGSMTLAKHFSSVEMNGKRKLCVPNDAAQKESSSSDRTEAGMEVSLEEQGEGGLLQKAADAEMDESSDKSADIDFRNILVSVEMNVKRKLCAPNGAAQKESSGDRTEAGVEVTLQNQFCPVEKQGKRTADAEMEESSDKSADIDFRKGKGKEAILSRVSRQHRAGTEAPGSCPSPSRRKRQKTSDKLPENQICREPVVILAWANWVSYESDEENEEPLINKRTERRKQERGLELFEKGKIAVDQNETLRLVETAELQSESNCPKETECNLQENNANEVAVIEHEVSERLMVTKLKDELIELSDDESFSEGTEEETNRTEEQMPNNHHFVPGHAVLDKRDFETVSLSQDGFTCTKRRAAPDRSPGKDMLPPGTELHGIRESTVVPTNVMTCPICTLIFPENEQNTVVNQHIDECLRQSS